MSSYHRPYREWSRFWLWGTLSPDGRPWACWGWHWSFPHLHTRSRQWSQHGTIFLPLLCQNAECCDGPQVWRCNQSTTALWWGRCLWLKLCGQKTELQEIIQILQQYSILFVIQYTKMIFSLKFFPLELLCFSRTHISEILPVLPCWV